MQNLLELDQAALGAFCRDLGEKPFRATQLFRWIHQRGVSDIDQMTDISKGFRAVLKQHATITPPPLLQTQYAQDGVIKWLFDMGHGNAIETVYIPETDRATLCVSSQVGCAVGCRFCATGYQGFARQLTVGEIIGQLWWAEHHLRQNPPKRSESMPPKATQERQITNVVMMGMGEPLQNYHALIPALRTMLSDHGYGLSRRRVTVSTSGMVPMMARLAQDCPVALAVSLHAPTDALRTSLIPLNQKYPIAELLDACLDYLPFAPRDFITIEYCLLRDVNDTLLHAQQLSHLLRTYRGHGVPCKVNLIPVNPFQGSDYQPSSPEGVKAFTKVLLDDGIVTTVRKTRGNDIAAACGQLAGDVHDRTHIQVRWNNIKVSSKS